MIEWLSDPQTASLIKSLSAPVTALVASITAIFLAFVSYPRQKELDRKYEISKEQREIYRNFLHGAARFRKLILSDDASDEIEALRALAIEIAIFGNTKIGKEAMELVQSIDEPRTRAEQLKQKLSAEKQQENIDAVSKELKDFSSRHAERIAKQWTQVGAMIQLEIGHSLGTFSNDKNGQEIRK